MDEEKQKKLFLELAKTGKEIGKKLYQISALNKAFRDFIEHKGLMKEFGEWYVNNELDKMIEQRKK